MKISIKKRSGLLLLSVMLLMGCSSKESVEQRVIATSALKKATLDNGGEYTEVKILKTYPSQTDNSNKEAANLYICKNIAAPNDTIYVFDDSGKVPSFAKDTSIDIGVSIDKREMKTTYPKNVIVFVPKQFIIPKNAKYVFASLTAIGQ
jgi:hypothetical protein